MMAVVDDSAVTLAGKGHVFCSLLAFRFAEWTYNTSCIPKMCNADDVFNHFIEASLLRLNDLFSDAGLAFRLERTVFPPLLRGVM